MIDSIKNADKKTFVDTLSSFGTKGYSYLFTIDGTATLLLED
jgi:hypothetical protein